MNSKNLSLNFDIGRFNQTVTNDKKILLNQLKKYSKIVLFADVNAYKLHKKFLNDIKFDLVIELLPSEESKSLAYAHKLMKEITKNDLDRNSCFIAFGGGFIGDISGYIAAQFMRGIDLIQIPTTFMAMGDCIIGKVAINCEEKKNIFGSFSTPTLTFINPDFIETLPQKEIERGLVEVLKHFFVSNSDYLRSIFLERNNDKDYLPIIFESIKIKKNFVTKDPLDVDGTHKALSYGHTIANALETLDKKNFKHGDAVLIGMIIAAKISYKLGFLKEDFELHQKLCFSLVKKININFSPTSEFVDEMICLLKKDKLSSNGNMNLVLLHSFGNFSIRDNIPDKLIKECILDPLT